MPRFSVRPALAAAALMAAVPTLLIAAAPAEEAPEPPVVQSRTVEVRIENGETNVVVDGRPVPAERIRHVDGGLEVLDGDGRPMQDVLIPIPGTALPSGARPEGVVGGVRVVPGVPLGDQEQVMVFVGPDGRPQVVGGPGEMRWTAAAPPRPMLGIRMENAETGVKVVEVLPHTPAEAAGLRAGDIILTSEEGVLTTDRLSEKLRGFEPGQTVRMWVLRDGEKLEIEATLAPWRPELGGEQVEIELDDEDMPEEIRRVIRRFVGGEGGEAMDVDVWVERDEDRHDDQEHHGDHAHHGGIDAHRVLSVLREHLPELFENGEVEVNIEQDGDDEFELHIEVDRGGHDDDDHDDHHHDDDHHGIDDHAAHAHEMMMRELHAAFGGGRMEGRIEDQIEHMHRGLAEMHRAFEDRWPEIERELDHRLERFAREWDRRGEDFARGLESRLREFGEGGERLARGLEENMQRRAEQSEVFGRRVGEALRQSEERNRMLEERVARLEAMLERMMRRQAPQADRPADAPPADRPAPPDRPRRRGDRGGNRPDAPRNDA